MKLIFALLLSFACFAQKPSFKVEYTSSTNTIVVIDATITVTEFIESYDNPMSSIPSGRKEIVKTAKLSPAQLKALKAKIDQSGFWKLSKNEYGASGDERYYPYTIKATNGKKNKTVVYRSNPAATEQAPMAFSEVEKHLNELVKSLKF